VNRRGFDRHRPKAAADRNRSPPGEPASVRSLLYFRCGTEIFGCAFMRQKMGLPCTVSKNRYHAREAAAALLKMARATSDPAVAAGLIEAAANLKDQAGELPPPVSVKAPDVQTE
jgi:hypothetical protein